MLKSANDFFRRKKYNKGDKVIVVAGTPPNMEAATNLIRVHNLGDVCGSNYWSKDYKVKQNIIFDLNRSVSGQEGMTFNNIEASLIPDVSGQLALNFFNKLMILIQFYSINMVTINFKEILEMTLTCRKHFTELLYFTWGRMKIGITGFWIYGKRRKKLEEDGFEVFKFVRRDVKWKWNILESIKQEIDIEKFQTLDAIIHLAGESLAPKDILVFTFEWRKME